MPSKRIDTVLFSIIVPTYNRANLLKIAIQSVVNQTYTNWELIIVDDGSMDHTRQIVTAYQQDARIKYLHQANQERSLARNRGILEASGSYICFLDDDDYLLENHLMTFWEAIEKYPSPLMILRTGFYRKKGAQSYPSDQYRKSRDGHPVRFAAFHFCSACTLCIPAIFLEEDQFAPSFRHWQDTHLILRLLAKHPFRQLPTHTYIYVHHPIMGSQTIYNFPDARNRIQNNVDAIKDLFKEHGELVRPILPARTEAFLVAQKYLDHAHGALKFGNRRMAWELFRFSWETSTSSRLLVSRGKFVVKALCSKF
ncbi:MAG: glycosyltransferase family 2 protein [Cyanothece sp. SIO1E1]|nr:glycosyltransferase family 2 protein [Cyanothece sp. SIO1E1]